MKIAVLAVLLLAGCFGANEEPTDTEETAGDEEAEPGGSDKEPRDDAANSASREALFTYDESAKTLTVERHMGQQTLQTLSNVSKVVIEAEVGDEVLRFEELELRSIRLSDEGETTTYAVLEPPLAV